MIAAGGKDVQAACDEYLEQNLLPEINRQREHGW